jgi:hypothetical protein
MTDFTNLAALVAQGQSLLDLVKGGHITKLEADNAAKLSGLQADFEDRKASWDVLVNGYVNSATNIVLTKNQTLLLSGTVPLYVGARSGVEFELVSAITDRGDDRDAGQMAFLTDIERDVKEAFPAFNVNSDKSYLKNFNIIRVTWDFTGLALPLFVLYLQSKGKNESAVSAGSTYTSAALVKLESGDVIQTRFFSGAEVGKWRYCSQVRQGIDYFGAGAHLTGDVSSETGSLLIALPLAVLGDISTRPGALLNPTDLG